MRFKLILSLMAVFQILILVNFVFANNYLLGEVFSVDEIGEVSAGSNVKWWELNESYQIKNEFRATHSIGDTLWSCCPRTTDGAICQDVGHDDIGNCALGLLPASCEYVEGCERGCCFDEEEGLCSSGSPEAKCAQEGGVWKDNANCAIEECQKGCCVLGDQVQFMTEERCGKVALTYGYEKDFRDLQTELECLVLQESLEMGACVFDGGVCKFGTETECFELGGAFSKDNLCSNPSLNTICEKQETVSCLEGKDEIYWFDSCGNRENIYSSNKDESWNDGKVLAKGESCGAGSNNAGSLDCGNCNHLLGSSCDEEIGGVRDAAYVCRDLNCPSSEETGNIARENGESWCVYDSYIGDGKDTVGSRHWKRMCINGEVKVEPCADYRGQICVQADIENAEKTENFTTAQCVINEAIKCITLGAGKECVENEDCVVKDIYIDEGFKFETCVGQYPRGFDLSKDPDEGVRSSRELCGMANMECKVIYVKDWKGSWNCKSNCNCENQKFAEEMNDLCISMGDCGSYINYMGEGSDNIKVTNSPEVEWNEYVNFKNVVEGKFAKPNNIEYLLKQMTGRGSGGNLEAPNSGLDESSLGSAAKIMGTVSGATGALVKGVGALMTTTTITTTTGGISTTTTTASLFGMKMSGGAAAGIQAVGTVAAAATIGMLVGSIGAWAFGIGGQPGALLPIVGAVTAGAVATTVMVAGALKTGTVLASVAKFLTFGHVLGPLAAAMVWAIIVVVAMVIYTKLIGWGDVKEVIVEFTCHTWQAPVGGDNCEVCDDDILKPCSKYRCNSLGAACKFINDETENPTCDKIEDDKKPPVISPNFVIDGYVFVNENSTGVDIRETGGDCIPEFTHVVFALDTDEYAHCKFDYRPGINFETMTGIFAEETQYSMNHTGGFIMPSIDLIEEISGQSRNETIEKFGRLNMFVKCQDVYGDTNPVEYRVNVCVKPGPDLTPPKVLLSNLQNESQLGFELNEISALFYMNEPSECRWEFNEASYDEMGNTMDCDTGIQDYKMFGWECRTTIGGLTDKETKVYMKCKDQPWLVEDVVEKFDNETNETIVKTRNVNSESYIYTIRKVNEVLEIDSISPVGIVKGGFEPVTVELEVRTSKGADNGKANCYYGFEQGEENRFFTTGGNRHQQTFDTILKGDYKIYVTCRDASGDFAKNSTEFEIYIDSDSPQVVRVYKDNNKLTILTDELAECYYDSTRCNFNIENATSMTTTFSQSHSTQWIDGKVYYIRCRDVWDNTNSECAIKVRAE